MAKRKQITVLVTLSVHPRVTAAEARRELRTRVNELREHHCVFQSGLYAEEKHVRVAKLEAVR